jgi:hypothetical protein
MAACHGMIWIDRSMTSFACSRYLNYAGVHGYSIANISIRRDYLEDYLSRKNCVAIATYFDERYSLDDPEIKKLIHKSGFSLKQPGRQLWFKSMNLDFANQISQVSACTTLLVPHGKPISDPVEEDLPWPDRTATSQRGREGRLRANGACLR